MTETEGRTLRLPPVFANRFAGADHPVATVDDRLAHCYALAGRAQTEFALAGWHTTLVHGHVGPHKNPHAWLEFRSHGMTWVWDPVLDRVVPKSYYGAELAGRTWTSYTVGQAMGQQILAGDWGPWGPTNQARYEKHAAAMRDAGVGR